jgi:TIR domain
MRWFLSYHSPDQALAERLKAAIERKDSTSRVFFAPTHMRAGGFWSAQLAQEIADATAFILLIGKEVGGSCLNTTRRSTNGPSRRPVFSSS